MIISRFLYKEELHLGNIITDNWELFDFEIEDIPFLPVELSRKELFKMLMDIKESIESCKSIKEIKLICITYTGDFAFSIF